MTTEKYLTEPSDKVKEMLLKVNSPCAFKVGNVLVYMSCEEIIGWMRKEHDLIVSINYMSLSSWASNDMYEYCIRSKKHSETICGSAIGYKEALDAALLSSLNLIKTWEEE